MCLSKATWHGTGNTRALSSDNSRGNIRVNETLRPKAGTETSILSLQRLPRDSENPEACAHVGGHALALGTCNPTKLEEGGLASSLGRVLSRPPAPACTKRRHAHAHARISLQQRIGEEAYCLMTSKEISVQTLADYQRNQAEISKVTKNKHQRLQITPVELLNK